MAGSEASEDLQRAWVATINAIQDVLGAVENGNCFLVAMTGPDRSRSTSWASPCSRAPAMQASSSEKAEASTACVGARKNGVEALVQDHTKLFDIFGDGQSFLTMAEIRLLMASLDGSSRGLPSQRGIRND